MQPTYTIEELRERIPELDNDGIQAMQKVISEEVYRLANRKGIPKTDIVTQSGWSQSWSPE